MSTAGPISGFIVQPIVGAISDKYDSKFGRRRPFIVVGTIFTAVGMALIATSVQLGVLLGDNPEGPDSSDHIIGLAFAIGGLWLMNLFTNVIQGPARALVNDVTNKENNEGLLTESELGMTDQDKLQLANAITAGVMAISAIAANIVGAYLLYYPNPYFIIFLIGTVFVLFTMIPTIITGKEKQYYSQAGERRNIAQVFNQIFTAFRTMPKAMAKVVLIYFLSWVAYTPLMINQTLLFSKNVYPMRPKYGIVIGMHGLALFAALAFNFSLMLPFFVKRFGPKITYIGTQIVATGCYFAIFFIKPLPSWEALLFTSVTAWNFTAFNSIPFAITTDIVGTEKCGLYMGVLNSASVIAQTVSGAIVTPLLHAKNNDVTWAILLGAVFSILAIFAAFFLETRNEDKNQLQEVKASD